MGKKVTDLGRVLGSKPGQAKGEGEPQLSPAAIMRKKMHAGFTTELPHVLQAQDGSNTIFAERMMTRQHAAERNRATRKRFIADLERNPGAKMGPEWVLKQ